MNETQTVITTFGQSEPRSHGKEWVLHIHQSSRSEASPFYALVSYPGYSLVGVSHLCLDCSCRGSNHEMIDPMTESNFYIRTSIDAFAMWNHRDGFPNSFSFDSQKLRNTPTEQLRWDRW